MPLTRVWRKLRWSLAQRGLSGTLRIALRSRAGHTKPVRHPFDARHGTDTSGVIGGGSLGVGSSNDTYITAYVGVAPSRLRAALDRWAASLDAGQGVEAFHFVDLGCGKGRALLIASERPFASVTGVELNPELASVAQSNLARWQTAALAKSPVCAVQGDATEVNYPGGSLLVFLYNPFGVPVVKRVLDALERHVLVTRCRVDLLFQNEGPEMPLRSDPRLRLLWTAKLPILGEDAAAEPVGSPDDVTSLYRWVG